VSDSTPLPPPPPPSPDASDAATPGRSHTALIVLAAVASIAALVFGVLWLNSSSSTDDAIAERDLALSERDMAIASGIELNNELETTRDQLADAEAAAATDDNEAGADTTEIDELQAEVDRLTAEVERLTEENASLQADLTASTTPPVTVPPETTIAPETTAAPETTVAPTTAVPADVPPPSVDEVGDWLASLYRSSVLGQGQKDCLAQTILDELGGERLRTLLDADDADEDQPLIDALQNAASSCGVDPSAIFG